MVLATRTDGQSFLQFTKSSLPILSAWRSPQRWRIEYAQPHLAFGGTGPPGRRWTLLHLAEALRGQPCPDGIQFRQRDNGQWELINLRSGETLSGYLNPQQP